MDNQKIFVMHPDRIKAYQTSDGFMFWDKAFADAHANTLRDKSVTMINKSQSVKKATEEPVAPVNQEVNSVDPVEETTEAPVKKAANKPAKPSKKDTKIKED